MSNLDHHDARRLAFSGYVAVFDTTPALSEVQFLQAIGFLETGYGTWWNGAGADSFNMGAITAGKSWPGPTFEYRDSAPDDQGNNRWYTTKFRKYADARAGWIDLTRQIYENRASVLFAAKMGTAWGVSEGLYRTKYYLGFGADDQTRIANHHRALLDKLKIIARAMAEILPGDEHELRPILKRNSLDTEAIKEVQRRLSLAADGMFGPLTLAAVRAFQTKHGLVADGIVGPKTWAMLDLI